MAVRRVPVTGADPVKVEIAREAIEDGRSVVLPTETVYGIAAVPRNPASVERLRRLKGRPRELPLTLHVADPAELDRIAPRAPAPIRRLAGRFWPGPLTVVVPDEHGGSVGLRVPAHDFTRAVLRACGGLYLSSVNRSGEPPLLTPDEIERHFEGVDLLFDAGPPALGTASSVVRWSEEGLEVLREGILTRDDLVRAAARHVLFVCTGNTCRSPLAEALAAAFAAQELGIPPSELPRRGWRFSSGGTSALPGVPASEGSLQIAREFGVDLSGHRSRPVSRSDLEAAGLVYCMERSHRERLIRVLGRDDPRIRLLRPDGRNIPDPFGGPLSAYRRAAEEIAGAVQARIPEILATEDHD